MKKIEFIFLIFTILVSKLGYSQSKGIILGRPTDQTITASILFDTQKQFYIEYGTQSGVYSQNTAVITGVSGTPYELEIQNLTPNTRYFYRLQSKNVNATSYAPSEEYTFTTQRSPGYSYTFTIEADEHLYDKKGIAEMYEVTLANQRNDKPDFMLSLGDIFGDDHEPYTITSGGIDTLHKNYRPYLEEICHSIPFYVCLGNHEGEMDYYLNQNPPNNLAAMSTIWRNFYYPNPTPNGFYTGNEEVEDFGIGNPKNYYAWSWGDALFVVLDVYRYQSVSDTTAKPKNWDWTLGQAQYDWLKYTLENSNAEHKFVFAHHVSGQGRGGVEQAKLFEWGGYEPSGNYTFPNKRPNMLKPIHQLFVDNGVDIFFQGHDHLFAHEIMDGVTYQEVPMAADSTYEIGMLANADAYTSDTIPGTGHLRVNVTPSCVTVDFVRAYLPQDTLTGEHHNGEVAFSYTIGSCVNQLHELNTDFDCMVFPNPANEYISVKLNSETKLNNVRLLNLVGEQNYETNKEKINTREIASGAYIMSISTDQGTINKKIIIRH